MIRFKIAVLFYILMVYLFSIPVYSNEKPNGKADSITKKDRDIILLMCAIENPNYDIVLCIDISNSMYSVLPEWKKMAEKAVEIACNGDTLVLLRFDATTRTPIIQEIQKDRDKELFIGNIRRTDTTNGWGTDVRKAYWLALKTLRDFDDVRKKKGEPVRLQQIIFISDGDDLPPEQSPFRNPASGETIELENLIKEAAMAKRINVIPIGMEFKNYIPRIRAMKEEGQTSVDQKISKELKEFMDKLQDVLNRKYDHEIKDDNETVPKAPYRFYIEWLSNRLDVRQSGKLLRESPYSYCKRFSFDVVSHYRKIRIKDLKCEASYNGTGGGRIKKDIKANKDLLMPGETMPVPVQLAFPKNWSFNTIEYKGRLDFYVSGVMCADSENVSPSPQQSPQSGNPIKTADTGKNINSSPRAITYYYPVITRTVSIPVSGSFPPCIELYLLVSALCAGLVAVIGIFFYRNAMPLIITLKTDNKARAYKLKNNESITIGGSSDFEIDGCQSPVAAIRRDGRRFYFNVKKEGILSETTYGAGVNKIEVKPDMGISLNIDGSYMTLQVLLGDQEDSPLQENDAVSESSSSSSGEETSGFNF